VVPAGTKKPTAVPREVVDCGIGGEWGHDGGCSVWGVGGRVAEQVILTRYADRSYPNAFGADGPARSAF
jgi:hypothetical protein